MTTTLKLIASTIQKVSDNISKSSLDRKIAVGVIVALSIACAANTVDQAKEQVLTTKAVASQKAGGDSNGGSLGNFIATLKASSKFNENSPEALEFISNLEKLSNSDSSPNTDKFLETLNHAINWSIAFKGVDKDGILKELSGDAKKMHGADVKIKHVNDKFNISENIILSNMNKAVKYSIKNSKQDPGFDLKAAEKVLDFIEKNPQALVKLAENGKIPDVFSDKTGYYKSRADGIYSSAVFDSAQNNARSFAGLEIAYKNSGAAREVMQVAGEMGSSIGYKFDLKEINRKDSHWYAAAGFRIR